MDEHTFRADLMAAGYSQIDTTTIDPRPANPEYAHDHDIRGLVLDGAFIVWQDGHSIHYPAGSIFSVRSGIKHAEEIGPDGARVVIGRRWTDATA